MTAGEGEEEEEEEKAWDAEFMKFEDRNEEVGDGDDDM
jgi:hypothetical protein